MKRDIENVYNLYHLKNLESQLLDIKQTQTSILDFKSIMLFEDLLRSVQRQVLDGECS